MKTILLFMTVLLMAGCSNHMQAPQDATPSASKKDSPTAAMQLTCTAFASGQPVPDQYTCHGQDISPPLKWTGLPAQTKSIAVTCEDPDAPGGVFTHWVIFNIPSTATDLPENVAKTGTLPEGAKQGKNSFGNIGYNGPCPPGGQTHHYIFKVYALDTALALDAGISKEDLISAMNGHVLAQAQYMGTFGQ